VKGNVSLECVAACQLKPSRQRSVAEIFRSRRTSPSPSSVFGPRVGGAGACHRHRRPNGPHGPDRARQGRRDGACFIHDRQRAGIDPAKAKGIYKGRPVTFDCARIVRKEGIGVGCKPGSLLTLPSAPSFDRGDPKRSLSIKADHRRHWGKTFCRNGGHSLGAGRGDLAGC
jgi:hypothetical protein